jgi:hypothetical protein
MKPCSLLLGTQCDLGIRRKEACLRFLVLGGGRKADVEGGHGETSLCRAVHLRDLMRLVEVHWLSERERKSYRWDIF